MAERSADWITVQERSFGSVRTTWLDRDYINTQLKMAVDTLRSDPNVLKVVLFGSFAEGRAVPGSDVVGSAR